MNLMPMPMPAVSGDEDVAAALKVLVRDLGTASHPYAKRLVELGRHIPREVAADALHFLCLLHGRKPSLFDIVAEDPINGLRRDWVWDISAAVAADRTFLSQLVVAVGPAPSLPRQMQAEEAAGGTRRGFLTLARSDRRGCALGSAVALGQDWLGLRPVIHALAKSLRIESSFRSYRWPSEETIDAAVKAATADPLVARAVLFGARTVVGQNRAFWDLLAARAQEIAQSAG